MNAQPPDHVVRGAIQASTFSPCRSKRGVAVFAGDHLLTTGHNWKPGVACDGSLSCKATCRVEAVHAEQAALLTVGYRAAGTEMVHVKSVNGRLVASGEPSCVQCSKLILVTGVSAVWLYHESGWRRYEAEEFHRLSVVGASVSRRHPVAIAWEAFRAHHAQVFDGSPDGRFLENRLQLAFQKGWDAAEDAVREALAKPR